MSKGKVITSDEVRLHNHRGSVWMVIRNEVYDVTSFLQEHPGGEDPLLEASGKDATIAFNDVGHSKDAVAMLKKYRIGNLAPGTGGALSPLKWAVLALAAAILIGLAYKKFAA